LTEGGIHAFLLRWLKFSAVGWMGVGVQLGTLALLTNVSLLHYLLATAMAVEVAILHNYLWHERWTWRDRGLTSSSARLARLFRFNSTTGLLSILGNVVFMRFFVGELGLPYLTGNLLSIASCAVANFLISDRFVFLSKVNAVSEPRTAVYE
jgi:putative flippase GtrA